VFAVACAGIATAGSVNAADTTELWPELSGFWQLNDRSRIHVDAAYALGKESDIKSLDAAAYWDVSLKPIARIARLGKDLPTEDWQRNKYLWARIGYVRVFEATDESGAEVVEDRGVIALYGRIPLPAAVWLETRTRADLRWIDDEYSNRYRFRLDFSREFDVHNHAVVPYGNFEWFYDTRYDDWSRTLATLGAEVTMTDHFRLEAYAARQADRVPARKDVDALGVVFKWYY
jgi:head-tail adaptor